MTLTKKYIEGGFYPAWLPIGYRDIIDLSELAEPTEEIIREANALMEILAANIAIYKRTNQTPKGGVNGLCSIFRSAMLQEVELARLYDAERRLENFVIVAYANPLQLHTKMDLANLRWDRV